MEDKLLIRAKRIFVDPSMSAILGFIGGCIAIPAYSQRWPAHGSGIPVSILGRRSNPVGKSVHAGLLTGR